MSALKVIRQSRGAAAFLAVICASIAFASGVPSSRNHKAASAARHHDAHRFAQPSVHHETLDGPSPAKALQPASKQDDIVWTRHALLDKQSGNEPRLDLFWNYDSEQGLLTFEIQAKTAGWVGVGFSPSGGMAGADIVVCWVKDGVATFQDRHAVQNGLPDMDESQDYTLISASENDTHTICRFSRKIDTCDIDKDYLIGVDTVRVIYAYGLEDPTGDDPYYHTPNQRGTTSIYILDPPTGVVTPDPETTKSFDVLSLNATVYGSKDTTYICSGHRAPSVDTKHQLIGYVPVIEPGMEKYVHHALVYECFLESDEEIDAMEQTVGLHAECYGSQMPPVWGRCANVFIAWAIGSEGQMYPENVGYAMKTASEGPTYYMMEMHYNNPTFDTFADNSGIRVYYTDVQRDLDMGVLEFGLSVTPFQMIPPKQTSFKSVAFCTASCTQNGLPEDGINVFAGLLHSHLLGIKMKLRLVRNGVEEPWFLNDDHYDFDFQETRVFPEIKKIYPGDILILECTLDSTERDGVTVGGWGTDDEMCLSFLAYYPKASMSRCLTYYEFDPIQAAIGFPDFIQDIDNLQFLVDENTTFTQFLNEKYAPWEDPETLQMFNDIGSAVSPLVPPTGFCIDDQYNLLSELEPTTYPEMVEYEPPPRECSAKTLHDDKAIRLLEKLHPGYEPVPMTKSLQVAFPKLAASGGHFYRKTKN